MDRYLAILLFKDIAIGFNDLKKHIFKLLTKLLKKILLLNKYLYLYFIKTFKI